MVIYLGSNKQKISVGSSSYYLNFYSTVAIVNGIALLSSDNYMLKDKNGLYLTAKTSNIADNVMILDGAKLDVTILA